MCTLDCDNKLFYNMINKVILLGNVGKDPEIRALPNGGRVASFPLATSESWKDKEGNKKEKTEWHNIVIFAEKLVNIAEKYIRKGSKLYIEASIRTRKYTDSAGVDKYISEIVIQGYNDSIKMLDSRQSDDSDSYSSAHSSSASDAFSDAPKDDDIPF